MNTKRKRIQRKSGSGPAGESRPCGVRVKNCLGSIRYLYTIKKLARQSFLHVYLVGGVLRDCILTAPDVRDYDFAVSRNTIAFARRFARTVSGRFIMLDRKQRNVRVAVRRQNKIIHYDFSALRGKTITSDILKRDFTVNTLSVDLDTYPHYELKDYLNGYRDLQEKIIRCASSESFRDDPLRILRVFSLAARFGFSIHPATYRLMHQVCPLLVRVAAERISEELFKIFESPDAVKILGDMQKHGVLFQLFPELIPMRNCKQGGYHHLDVLAHSHESVRCFEQLVKKIGMSVSHVKRYLLQTIGGGHTRLQLIKFACLFHDVGKPQAKTRQKKRTRFHRHEKIGCDIAGIICKRLRLSSKEQDFIAKLVYYHLRPGYLADIHRPSKRAVYRFFRDSGEDAVAVILLSLSDWRATRGPLTNMYRRRQHEKIMIALIHEYFVRISRCKQPRFLTGYDLMKVLHIKPSPLVGILLKKAEEAQALGVITTRTEAVHYMKKIYAQELTKTRKTTGQ